jgi:hypothetical protein
LQKLGAFCFLTPAMSPNAESLRGSAVQESAGAERQLREIAALIQRLLLIQATIRWTSKDLEDVHDTARLIVQKSAAVLSDRSQLRLPRF